MRSIKVYLMCILMLLAGVLGYVLRLFGVPVAPLLIAFILARPLEESLSHSLKKTSDSVKRTASSRLFLAPLLAKANDTN